MDNKEPQGRKIYLAQGIIPLILAIVLVCYIVFAASSIVAPNAVILPEIIIEKIEFTKTQILASVRNVGHVNVTIAQADINDRIQPSAVEPDAILARFEYALVRIPYEWNIGEPYEIGITLDDGTRFAQTVDAAIPALKADFETISNFIFIGILVGVIPVMIGLLWKSFIAKLGQYWRILVLGLTIGFLVFIAADTAHEALNVSKQWGLDNGFNGTLLVLTAGVLAFLAIQYISSVLKNSGRSTPMIIAILVAGGIGLHNLGEGLAIGASVALGQMAFTSFLIIGLAIHNITEGFAISAPVAQTRVAHMRLVCLGLLAGVPVIIGTVAGGLVFSPMSAVILLAAASGALVQVIISIISWMRSENMLLTSPPMLVGTGFGILILYILSILA